jgi:hypothetical protein
MKKYILTVAVLSIVPSIAFASWWNPLTWNIFSSHQPNPPVQIISTTTPPDQIPTDNSTTTAPATISMATTTEATVATTSTPQINIPIKGIVKKIAPSIKTPIPPVQVQTPVVSNPYDSKSTTCPLGYTCTPGLVGTSAISLWSTPSNVTVYVGQSYDVAAYKVQAGPSYTAIQNLSLDFDAPLWLYASAVTIKGDTGTVVGRFNSLNANSFNEITANSDYRLNIPVNNYALKATQVRYLTVNITFLPTSDRQSGTINIMQAQTSLVDATGATDIEINTSGARSFSYQNSKSWTELETEWFVKATQNGWTQLTITNDSGDKQYYRLENGSWVRKDTLAESQQPYQSPNTTPCNGTNWNQCPAGQNFVCPGNGGKAYCQSPQTVQTQTPQTTATPPVSQGQSEKQAALQQSACQAYQQVVTALQQLDYQNLYTKFQAESQQDVTNFINNSSMLGGGTNAEINAFKTQIGLGLSALTSYHDLLLSDEQTASQECSNNSLWYSVSAQFPQEIQQMQQGPIGEQTMIQQLQQELQKGVQWH